MKYKTSDLSWAGGDGAKMIQKRTEKLTHYTSGTGKARFIREWRG
jgi:hypothetical protein